MRTSEAAHFLSVSDRALEKHRTRGTGPVYHKIGGRVVYAVADLMAWLESAARRSSRPQGIMPPARPGEER